MADASSLSDSRKPHGEVDEELQFHLEQQTQTNIAAGMTGRRRIGRRSLRSGELRARGRSAGSSGQAFS